MTVKYSRALLQEVGGGKSWRAALEDFVLDVYEGTCPTNPEDVRTGTKLARYTLSGAGVAVTDRSKAAIWKIVVGTHVGSEVFKLGLTIEGATVATHIYTHGAGAHQLDDVTRGFARFINDIPQLCAIPSGNADGVIMVMGRIAGLDFLLTIVAGGTGTWTPYRQICGPITSSGDAYASVTFPTAQKRYANVTGIGTANPAGHVIHVTGGTGATVGSYTVVTVISADSVEVDRDIHAEAGDITNGTCITGPGAAIRVASLQFSLPTIGVLSKPTAETWQCSSNLATGVAGYFTICELDDCVIGSQVADTTYVKKRIQGTLATVGGDVTIDPATITLTAVSTVISFSITLPTSKT
jgi:hypothetical protein